MPELAGICPIPSPRVRAGGGCGQGDPRTKLTSGQEGKRSSWPYPAKVRKEGTTNDLTDSIFFFELHSFL